MGLRQQCCRSQWLWLGQWLDGVAIDFIRTGELSVFAESQLKFFHQYPSSHCDFGSTITSLYRDISMIMPCSIVDQGLCPPVAGINAISASWASFTCKKNRPMDQLIQQAIV